ncbi:MAG: ABC transporter ATP-binding protein [Acidimicrobiia bacterium]|nr:ABC transporter ATP-binding protein [Acidimicrobiia bacterium]
MTLPTLEGAKRDVATPILEVQGLTVEFGTRLGALRVVEDVSFTVAAGETVGLVGESGSGKSVSSLAVMGLISPRAGRVQADVLRFDGRDLLALDAKEQRAMRGSEMAMIFQEPMTSLNPVFTVGNQIEEAVRVHQRCSRKQARARAVEMLDRVGIADAHRRAKDYPHAFSGGMRQRAMIAMALINEPRLLIADEPTTALDVTIQAQILDLLRTLQRENGMSVVFVTHDLGVIAEIADKVVVMYAGQVVEHTGVEEIFGSPRHPYTEGLLSSMPQLARPGAPLVVIPGQVPNPDAWPVGCRFSPRCVYSEPQCDAAPVAITTVGESQTRCVRVSELTLPGSHWVALEEEAPAVPAAPVGKGSAAAPDALLDVTDLSKAFPIRSGLLRGVVGEVRAVDGVSFSIGKGETLGLVGESGSGKSTVARLVLRLVEPTAGCVMLDGAEVTALDAAGLRAVRSQMQIVFQDPYSSLDPRATIADTVGEPLEVHRGLRGGDRDAAVAELLERVGLSAELVRRYPHEFSGGQRQRIAIARALALEPSLLVLDEPVSSLDVSTQSQVINLLMELQAHFGLSYLFIAHDLSVVRHIADRIAVMYLGRIVEQGKSEEVYLRPTHPYTAALLSAIPVPSPQIGRRRERMVLEGDVPSPLDPPAGCRFHPRCAFAMDICAVRDPEPYVTETGTVVACHLHTEGPMLSGRPVTVLESKVGKQ